MSMTISEKILAKHAGKEKVEPGELINCHLDLVLGNDITAPVAIEEFSRLGLDHVFDSERVALVPDHFTPNKDIKSAEQSNYVRQFARNYKITNYFEVGRMGIEHCLLPEQGLVLPGDLIIGADSHTCTYGALGVFSTGVGSTDLAAGMALGECWFKVPESMKFIYHGKLSPWVGGKDLILYTIGDIGVDGALYRSMEFTGEAIANLSVDGRLTMCNMAIEAGAKNGIIAPDAKTKDYVEKRAKRPYQFYTSDPDAFRHLKPTLTQSHSGSQVCAAHTCGKDTKSTIGTSV
jgi:3-isopropylmalate/(R)-2-methylmalate dehydratase large subunit